MAIATTVGTEVKGGNKVIQFNRKYPAPQYCGCDDDHEGYEGYRQWVQRQKSGLKYSALIKGRNLIGHNLFPIPACVMMSTV